MDFSTIYTILSFILLYSMYSYWQKIKNQKIEEINLNIFCEECGTQIEEATEKDNKYIFKCKKCGKKGHYDIEQK